jgi:hypothetical protein
MIKWLKKKGIDLQMKKEIKKDSRIFRELNNMKIKCERTKKRIIRTITTLSKKPELSISAASENTAEAKAIYRLLGNKKFTSKVVISSHKESTIKIIKNRNEKIILSVQDTTELDYTNLKATKGLGVRGTKTGTKGLITHSAIAVNTEGIVLGLLEQKIWARKAEEHGKRKDRAKKKIEEKESYKWLECMENVSNGMPTKMMVVHVCDRESDIYEFLDKAKKEEHKFLIRANHNRQIENNERLFNKVETSNVAGILEAEIPRDTRKGKQKRTATFEIRYDKINIVAPKNKGKEETIEVQIVLAKEINAPEGIEPIKWYLLTNIEIANVSEAIEKVQWYVHRWKIERFHYVLKSGCNIEKLQEREAEKIKKLVTLYSIISIQILTMTYLSRVYPKDSCEELFTKKEWSILYCISNKSKKPPQTAPTIKEAILYIAKLGGFLGRKSDGDPGVKAIWRGYSELNTILKHYEYLV